MRRAVLTVSGVRHFVITVLGVACALMPCCAAASVAGRVVDFITRQPIPGAVVTMGDNIVFTDAKGLFVARFPGNKLAVRACGYMRAERFFFPSIEESLEIALMPFAPKALYLSSFGIGSRILREPALKLIEETELNALVIDVKGDRGLIPYVSSIPLASQVGAQKPITVRDMKGLMGSLKERGVYTIARVVVFKDDLLAAARPDLAVKTQAGETWLDREHLAWLDPFKRDVWDYSIDVAVEAAQYGFDEIQFDYVRFPDAGGLVFSRPNTEENRVGAICGFLTEAKRRLAPYNVFVDADVFGYVCWNLDDTQIGQRLEDLAACVEYICPMLYPSGFQFGIPGYRNPVANPREIVFLSLKRAGERTRLSPVRFRPWLQAFRDYAFDRRYFKAQEIRAQIGAAEEFGTAGWMLWNPRNIYSPEGVRPIKGQEPSAYGEQPVGSPEEGTPR